MTQVQTTSLKIPKLRFSEFSGEWKGGKLKDFTSYVDYRGRGPTKTKSGIFLITAKNIKKGYIDCECSKEYVSKENYLNVMSKGLPKKGDILFTTEAPLGNIGQIEDENIALAQRVIKFRGKENLNNNFLLYYMLSTQFQKIIIKKAIGSTVIGIQGKVLHNLVISIPSLSEQLKIASFLSIINEKIKIVKDKKELLKKYKKGVMQKIFKQEIRFKNENIQNFKDWQKKKLGKITKIFDGTHNTPKYVNSGIPFYSVEHLTANQFKKTKYITNDVFEKENKRVKLEKEDILMTRIGDIGTSKLINWDVSASFYVSLALIKQNKIFISSFLNQYIKSNNFQRELWRRTIHVAFPKKINLGEIGNCKVILPSIQEQQKIAEILDAIDKKIENINKEIIGTEKLKKGLLQNMFI